MTADAQAALRRVVEQYSRNTRFCMICNYVTKIIPALQSRCTKFRFAPLQGEQVRRASTTSSRPSASTSRPAVDALLELGNGDMRRILNVLQATRRGGGSSSAPAAMAVDGDTRACAGVRALDRPTPCTSAPARRCRTTSTRSSTSRSTRRSPGDGRDDDACRGRAALSDIITCVVETITCMELPAKALAPLLAELANIEYRLSCGASDALNTGALVGAFRAARSATPADVVLAPMAE